jgi:hypothetical protein
VDLAIGRIELHIQILEIERQAGSGGFRHEISLAGRRALSTARAPLKRKEARPPPTAPPIPNSPVASSPRHYRQPMETTDRPVDKRQKLEKLSEG